MDAQSVNFLSEPFSGWVALSQHADYHLCLARTEKSGVWGCRESEAREEKPASAKDLRRQTEHKRNSSSVDIHRHQTGKNLALSPSPALLHHHPEYTWKLY